MVKYLKGLDTLRAIAALIVVWGHIELLKKNKGMVNLIDNEYFNLPSGHIAVILFFVLSGFLITFLLVKEREKVGKISLKKFFIRRILRIWPLYYLILFLSFLLFNADYSQKTVLLCLSGFPNIAHALKAGWPTSPHVWSIGVEEQFYLFWPILLSLIPIKRIILTLSLFIIGYTILPHVICFINIRTFQNFEFNSFINELFYGTKFNCMSVGALVGFLYARQHKWLKVISNKFVAYSSIILSVLLWTFGLEFNYFTDEFYSVLFVIAIYNIVVNPKINIDTKATSFLGKISFGIYMYHWIIIMLTLKYLPISKNDILYNVCLYLAVLIGTIFISWISFNSVEKYFLNIKKQFETT